MDKDAPNSKPMFRLDKWVNLYELVFDIAIAGLSVLIYRAVSPGTGFLFLDHNPMFSLAAMALSQFFIVMFFGHIFRRYMEIGDKTGWVWVFTAAVLYIGINSMFFIMPIEVYQAVSSLPEIGISGNPESGAVWDKVLNFAKTIPFIGKDIGFALAPISSVFIILGFSAGFPRKDLKNLDYFITFPKYIMWIFGPLAAIFIFLKFGIIIGIVFVLLMAGAQMLNIYMKKTPKQEEKAVPKHIGGVPSMLLQITIPLATALALMIWQELMIVRAVRVSAAAGQEYVPSNIFLILVTGGLIPVRILAALAPPYRPVNTAFAAASLYVYFSSLMFAVRNFQDFSLK